MPVARPLCFVIMPFGKKPVGDRLVDFDAVWEHYLKPAAEQAEFKVERADSEASQAHISEHMIRKIYHADIAIADVTYHNPNVFYELGMRHALSRHGTILVKRKSLITGEGGRRATEKLPRHMRGKRKALEEPDIPFDVKDIAHLYYTFGEDQADLDQYIDMLRATILERHRAEDSDSPVFKHVPRHRVTTGSAMAHPEYNRTYEVLDASGSPTGKYMGYRAGDVAKLDCHSGRAVEYWVNSENTLMQMARMAEKAMSATIRYLGAREPDPDHPGYEDTIQNALIAALGNRRRVDAGEVIVTDSGRLRETHAVKAILHAAAVTGTHGRGFSPISVEATLEMISTIIATARGLLRNPNTAYHGRSLIMPLFGGGQAGRDPVELTGRIVETVRRDVLDTPMDLQGRDLTHVLFSAFAVADVKLMRRLFEAAEDDGAIRRVTGPSSMAEDDGGELVG